MLVRPSSGAPFMAARKRMPANRASALLLANELTALRAGAGCPNIVQLYDVRTTDAHVEVLLELVEGGSVADELVGAGGVWATAGHCGGGAPRGTRAAQAVWRAILHPYNTGTAASVCGTGYATAHGLSAHNVRLSGPRPLPRWPAHSSTGGL